jgi:predicted permease
LTVSGNYFNVLGGQPGLGRLLTPQDDVTPGAHAVAVLSEGFWHRQFGGDPALVGRTVRFNGRPYEVIGIAAGDFVGTQPNVPDFWVPLTMRAELAGAPAEQLYTERAHRSVALYGRLKPGVSLAQAAAALNAASSVVEGQHPTTRISIASASTFVSVKEFMPLIAPMSLAVGLVLVVACTNVANLLLARATRRQREIEIRLAVGSSYRRLIRQLITESLVLGVLGGAAGLAASQWAIAIGYPAVLSRVPLPSGYRDAFTVDLNPDWRILAFGVSVSIAASVLFGLAPAINSARARVASARSRFRDSLVVAQVAICLVLLVASGLLVRSMWFVEGLNPGFQTAGLYAASAGLTGESNPSMERSVTGQFASRLDELPALQSVSVCYNQPLSGMSPQTGVDGTAVRVAYNSVGSRYFRTVGIPLIRGRDFTDVEASANAPVAIVSEGTASRAWPNQDALGKTIRLAEDGVARQVIGVVSNARVGILWRPEDAYVYLPIGSRSAYTIFRAPSWSVSAAESTVRDEAAQIHPALRAPVRAIEDSLEYAYAPFRFLAAVAGLIAALTLVMACVGLYGVVSLMVSQRTQEIGIRMALGAMRSDVMRTVFQSSLRLVAVGVAIGLCGGLAFARLLAVALIGVKPFDPAAFASTSSLMVVVAALATWVPARRAAAVDPIITLRHE